MNGYAPLVGAPEPDPKADPEPVPGLAPLRGPWRHAAVLWVLAVVALYAAGRFGFHLVR